MKYCSGEPNGTKMKLYNCKTKSDGNPFHDLEPEMWALEIPHSFTHTPYRHGIHDDGKNTVVFCGAYQYRRNDRTKQCLVARIMVDYTLTK